MMALQSLDIMTVMLTIKWTWVVLAAVMALGGLAGSIVPGLPGPPLSWLGLLFVALGSSSGLDTSFLIITAIVAAVITIVDYIVPSMSTRRHGGSKAGVRGCNIGLVISIIGLPLGPQGLLGIIFWPFAGAFVGELISGKHSKEAFHAAVGAFIGFLTGTGLKVVYAIFAIVVIVKVLF